MAEKHQFAANETSERTSRPSLASREKLRYPSDMRVGFHTLVIIAAITQGCSSSTTRRSTSPDDVTYETSNADAAAYGVDYMFTGKEQQIRPANDFQFFFKKCTQGDKRAHYSKTSYWCDDR